MKKYTYPHRTKLKLYNPMHNTKRWFFEKNLKGGWLRTFISNTENKSHSFIEVELYSNLYANLLKNMGVKKGDKICLIATRTTETILYYIAILKLGAIYVPINPESNISEINHVVNDSTTSTIIFPTTHRFVRNSIKESGINHGIKYIEMCGLKNNFQNFTFNPFFRSIPRDKSEIACILYTSGTTGKPKGVMLSYAGIELGLQTLLQVWGINNQDKILHTLSLSHGYGLMSFNLGLYAQCQVLLPKKNDSGTILKLLPKSSVFFSTPSIYKELIEISNIKKWFPLPRLLVSGTNTLTKKVFNDFRKLTDRTIIDRYGMTETIVNTTNIPGLEFPGSCGQALPNVKIRITDDYNNPLPFGKIGNIEIKSPLLFSGYWNDTIKTKEVMTRDGFFITGDIGKIDSNGNLFITARKKEVIIHKFGFKIYPKEIESYIEEIEGLEEIAIIGIPSNDNYEKISLFVTVKEGFEKTLPPETIKNLIAKKVSHKKIPSCVHILDSLPKNKAGKITKEELKKIHLTFPLH